MEGDGLMGAPLEGTLLSGQFRVTRKVGEGGMAIVYLARDERHGRDVAVKVLRPDSTVRLSVERFHREVEIAASLHHPHVIPLYTSGEHEGRLYFVMPFVEGDTLRAWIGDSRLPLVEAVKFAMEIADGLEYAHGRGIIHRDIKPSNIFLVRGHAVVADFGIARALGADPALDLTVTRSIIGTPLYMSPEQALDGTVDVQSDLYSLACVLYEMLTGKPPFPTATAFATFAMRQSQAPPAVSAQRPDVPPVLDQLVSRALAPVAGDRFQSAEEFGAALLDCLDAVRSEARATSKGPPPHRLRIAPPRMVFAFVLAAVAVAIAIIGTRGGEAGGGRSIRVIAVFPFEEPAGGAGDGYFAGGVTQELRDGLSRRDQLLVASGESSITARREAADASAAANRLDLDGFVEGSVSREGGTIRLSVRLIDARSNRQEWGGTFSAPGDEIFGLQAAIVDSLTRVLGLADLASGADPLRARTTDVATHNLYLQGRFVASDRTPEALDRARMYFSQAIVRDSMYAPAWAALASTYALTGVYEYRSWLDLRPEVEQAAAIAIRLDPTLAEAYTARGVLLDYQFRWAEAEEAYTRALELNPSDATAYHWYAVSKVLSGQPSEAPGLIEQARHLNPLSFTIAAAVGWVYYYRRDLETAISRLRLALDLEPNAWIAYQYLGLAYSDLGRHEEGIEALERAMELNPSALSLLPGLARAYALQGEFARARETLDRARVEGAPMAWLAIGHLALDESDEAMAWLERARDAGPGNVIELNTFWFEPLADEPRFRTLVTELHAERG